MNDMRDCLIKVGINDDNYVFYSDFVILYFDLPLCFSKKIILNCSLIQNLFYKHTKLNYVYYSEYFKVSTYLHVIESNFLEYSSWAIYIDFIVVSIFIEELYLPVSIFRYSISLIPSSSSKKKTSGDLDGDLP